MEELTPIRCPDCGELEVYHLDLGDETDSDGTYGNHRIICECCGRRTTDQNTFMDAVEAFVGTDDTVIRGDA